MTLLHRDQRGELRAEGNEMILEDRVSGGDPVAFRMRSINETIGKLSIDMQLPNGVWKEVGYIGFGRDERGRTDPAHASALEIEVWSHIPGRDFEDPNYEKILVIRHDGLEAPGLGSRAEFDHLTSPNGRFLAKMQDDGNFVVYDKDPDQNPSTPWWSAVWSWFTGRI